ncbi:antibiotic biosynthesis monooxygenase [Halobacterium wangiae]|uniref:antibiotic biosynthesis monooxygenase n=1 Tax=Halobacterium wangiae TaxID=2902623 RepID=UPI001E53DB50|nr:antibiotic biosynthesis monooxygenase [Halobacterium wangiae]
MQYLLGKSEVEDFDEWKSNFEDNDSFRSEHGQQGFQVFQSVDDPNETVVLFEWDDAENARDLFQSDEMRERLVAAGLKGEPDLTFLERVDQRP